MTIGKRNFMALAPNLCTRQGHSGLTLVFSTTVSVRYLALLIPADKKHLCTSLACINFCGQWRSEEHTSELQSRGHLVCRLLLEKKNNERISTSTARAREQM